MNQNAEVKEPFKLLASNNDNAEVTAVLKAGTKITLVKADITPAGEINRGYIEDMMCDWFLIKTSNGVKGWCRLKDFHEKVDGLIWAG
ncbi:MAG: SH3 domain-containing protein [Chlorobi bacterium]|nr:SH3 domain-containing protein [Chlorobiota bacterium]